MRLARRIILGALAAALSVGGTAVVATTASAEPQSAPRLYGAQVHLMWDAAGPAEADTQLDALAGLGADTLRLDVAWASLQEGGRGQLSAWYVDRLDHAVSAARARGIRPIVTLLDTPCWASSAPESLRQGCAGAYWTRGTQFYAPADPADFAWAAQWVARRYGSDLAAIELWNEPNYDDGSYATLRAADSAVAYAGMVEAAYPAVKAVAPGLPVLAGALSYSDTAYVDRLAAAGMQHFDGLSVHPYDEGRAPWVVNDPAWVKADTLRGLPLLHDDLVRHGFADRSLWITELGWSTCAAGSSSWCVSAADQARYLAAVVDATRDWSWVRALVTYTLRDGGTDPADRESNFGLTRHDGTPKAAYAALRDAIVRARSGGTPNASGRPAADPEAVTPTSTVAVAPTARPSRPVVPRRHGRGKARPGKHHPRIWERWRAHTHSWLGPDGRTHRSSAPAHRHGSAHAAHRRPGHGHPSHRHPRVGRAHRA